MAKKKVAMIPLPLRRGMVSKFDKGISVSRQCRLLGLHRSGLYYTPSHASEADLRVMRMMDGLYLEDPTRGTRRYSADLAQGGVVIGRDKVRTMMRMMGIEALYCRPRTTVSAPAKYKFPYLLRELEVEKPNQVWQVDISYIPMRRGFMYLCAVIDVYSRCVGGWGISNSMEAQWVVETMKDAVAANGKPEIINSDQGSQFTSDVYVAYVKGLETVRISMDGKGRATDNAHVERFFRTIKHDKLYRHVPEDGRHLHSLCKSFIDFYNNRRSHSSIGKQPPMKIYKSVA